MPSADWMLVSRNMYFGLGTALSNRKSVQPSMKIVSKLSSSATGPSAGRVAARDDAGEEVDLALELHAPKLFDVGVGAGGLVGGDGLDLALAREAALGVDLLGRQDVALERRLAEHRGRAGQEGHVPGLVGRIRNLALGRLGGGLHQLRSGDQAGTGKAGPADRDARARRENFGDRLCGFVHGLSPCNARLVASPICVRMSLAMTHCDAILSCNLSAARDVVPKSSLE